MCAYVRTYIHTHIYIHTYTYMYIKHTYMQMFTYMHPCYQGIHLSTPEMASLASDIDHTHLNHLDKEILELKEQVINLPGHVNVT